MVFLYTYLFIKGYTKYYIFRDNIELIYLLSLVIPRNIIMQYKEILLKKFNDNFDNHYELLYLLQINGINGHKIMCFFFQHPSQKQSEIRKR